MAAAAAPDRTAAAVKALAGGSSVIVTPWWFTARERVLVNGVDVGAYAGTLVDMDPRREIGAAIKLGDWVFCLERHRVPEQRVAEYVNSWALAAFYAPDQSHYTFAFVPEGAALCERVLLPEVIRRFMPLLLPPPAGAPTTADVCLERMDKRK